MNIRRFLEMGRRDSPPALKALGLVAAIALAVAGCSSSNDQSASAQGPAGSSPSSSTSTSRIGSTPTGPTAPSIQGTAPTPGTAVAGTPSRRPRSMPSARPSKPVPPVRAGSAQKTALLSCRTWRSGAMQNAALGSARLRVAGRTAARASSLDARWKPLAKSMTYVSSLPITDNSPAAVAKARAEIRHIRSTCAALGVVIPV
jgi:hypothetical protein